MHSLRVHTESRVPWGVLVGVVRSANLLELLMTQLLDATGHPAPPSDQQRQIPIAAESMGGSLIDSARITVIAALGMLPEFQPITASPLDEDHPSLHQCLEQAMQWLDAARVITIEMGAPVTSLHVVTGADRK